MSKNLHGLLLLYGEAILSSADFQKAFAQTHHGCTNVGAHSIGVALYALAICSLLEKIHVKTNMRNVTIAALCHDLGILGRYEKFKNNRICCKQHPIDSITVYKKVFGEMDAHIEDAIRHHMWPLTIMPPKYHEGYIITVADKLSALSEVLGHSPARFFNHFAFYENYLSTTTG